MLLFSSAYNEYTVISKEYTGPLDFDVTGVDCISNWGILKIYSIRIVLFGDLIALHSSNWYELKGSRKLQILLLSHCTTPIGSE